MPDVTLFCEDSFHEKFVGALLNRFRDEHSLQLNLKILSARGGLPRMAGELKDFLRDLSRDRYPAPDALIVVSDANCHGYHDRKGQLAKALERCPALEQTVSYAISDPHVERWMLCDAKAFKSVFGRGCTLPANKCQKDE